MGFVELTKFVTIHTPERPFLASSIDMGAGSVGTESADTTAVLAAAGGGEPFAGGVAQAAVLANNHADALHAITVLICPLR